MPHLIFALGAATKFLPFSSKGNRTSLFPASGWCSCPILNLSCASSHCRGHGWGRVWIPRGNGCCSWTLNTEISSCSSVGSYTDFERRAQRESAQEGQAEALRTKCRLHVVGWSQLGARSKAALWLPSAAGKGGKKKTKVSWVQGRGKSLANDCHGQKRLHLGKLV